MSKPQTPEDILQKHAGDVLTVYEISSRKFLDAMKEHARQAIKYALEDVENSAQVMFEGDDYKTFSIDRDDLRARYESILKELNL